MVLHVNSNSNNDNAGGNMVTRQAAPGLSLAVDSNHSIVHKHNGKRVIVYPQHGQAIHCDVFLAKAALVTLLEKFGWDLAGQKHPALDL